MIITPRWAAALFVLLTAVGVARIVSTYRAVAQTVDETPNIACGMEWLDRGTYLLGPFHPPLARIAMALPPYLAGFRSQGLDERFREGNAILHSRGRYPWGLTLARTGILPFFVLAAATVWLWGRWLLGEVGGLWAVLIFTNLPPVLAHSGLATTDIAVGAGVAFTAFRFARWLNEPDWGRAVWLGIALVLALGSKFSAFMAVPVCLAGVLVAQILATRRWPRMPVAQLALAAMIAFILLWGAYRFEVGRLEEPVQAGWTEGSALWRAVCSVPVPAPKIVDGLLLVRGLNRDGHPAWLRGELRHTGWWYFFPLVLALKTPLSVLLLAAAGVWAAWKTRIGSSWAPALCFASLLGVCLFSHLNTGVRYILFLFPLLAIAAAQGLDWLMRRGRGGPILAAALLLWLCSTSLLAHPDYIPYFNELAGGHPELIVSDSDIDWGQDVKRLSVRLRELGVKRLYFACLWSGDDTKLGLPDWDGLEPYQPVKGWVAISETTRHTYGQLLGEARGRKDSAYGWLDAYTPVERVGKSILLYHIPE